jgi:fructose-1,6-bisphosphatase I
MYPATKSAMKGKLRLLYECFPMSFIVEQAGGRACDGLRRILDIDPKELHERSAIFMGSKSMVERIEDYVRQSKATEVIPSSSSTVPV